MKSRIDPKYILFYFFAWFLLGSCRQNLSDEDIVNSSTNNGKDPIVIEFQPFSGIPKEYIEYVHTELKKIYPHIQVNDAIPLPEKGWYAPRNRYRADTLIDFLRSRTPDGHVTIGMTNKDISHTKGDIKDFGLMGLGFCPGKACVVSYFRLSKNNTKEQFFKLSIHELGHTQGLPHCPVKTCFMRDAEGKNHTNEEKEFCPKCTAHLVARGWIFFRGSF